ncbi:hypothetical protein ACQ4M4_12150 [Leptolyngbya sp. AN02str]|uniref:hypothetical protein n=1 Tax=Leptolyngbya sp. AN02str TaxID=3423363 RepID=UPI003D31A941
MDSLRQPLLFFAIALMAIVVAVEVGANAILQSSVVPGAIAATPVVGYGIPYLAWIDGLVLFTTVLIGLPLLITHRLQGKVQGLVTLIFALVLLLMGIRFIFTTLAALIVMVTLLVSPIFGTIAYFGLYADFDRAGAAVTLSLLMVLKLIVAGCLLTAQQRFLQNTGLVLLLLTSFVATLVVGFLHGFVPTFLMSITDAIAGLIVLILAMIWLIVFLIGAIVSLIKLILGTATSIIH